MRNIITILIFGLALSTCTTTKKTSIEITLPSSTIKPGQIIQKYTKDNKIVDLYTPIYNWRVIKKVAIDSIEHLSGTEFKNKLSTKVIEIANIKYNHISQKNVTAKLKNIKKTSIDKIDIYNRLLDDIKLKKNLQNLILMNYKRKKNIYVVTSTLSADVEISIIDSLGRSTEIDFDILKSINSELNTNFFYKSGNKNTIFGSNLIISFEAEKELIDDLLKGSNK